MVTSDADRLQLSERVRAALGEVRRSRYPVLLLLADPEQMAFALWQGVADAQGLALVDVLSARNEPGFAEVTGTWPTLVDWIRRQAIENGGVMVADLDALVTKWPERERERLFVKLLRSETRDRQTREAAPIVIVTALARLLRLPSDTRNYGVVMDLAL